MTKEIDVTKLYRIYQNAIMIISSGEYQGAHAPVIAEVLKAFEGICDELEKQIKALDEAKPEAKKGKANGKSKPSKKA